MQSSVWLSFNRVIHSAVKSTILLPEIVPNHVFKSSFNWFLERLGFDEISPRTSNTQSTIIGDHAKPTRKKKMPKSWQKNTQKKSLTLDFICTMLCDWESPKPLLCSKLALFMTSWKKLRLMPLKYGCAVYCVNLNSWR